MIKETITMIADILETIGMSGAPFFIAGGYPLAPKKASDIDVFFERSEDAEKIRSSVVLDGDDNDMLGETFVYLSNNAVTLHSHPKTKKTLPKNVQFITRHDLVGTPKDVLGTFDLKCCKRAWLSTGEVYESDDFLAFPVECVPERVTVSTLERYAKYTHRFGDHVMPGLQEIINIFVEKFDVLGDYGDSGGELEVPYSYGIAVFGGPTGAINDRVHKMFINVLTTSCSGAEIIDKFTKILGFNHNFRTPTNIPEAELARYLFCLERSVKYRCHQATIDKYPEYFV